MLHTTCIFSALAERACIVCLTSVIAEKYIVIIIGIIMTIRIAMMLKPGTAMWSQ